MICNQCNERPASVSVKQKRNEQLIERHLCYVCAAESHNLNLAFEHDPLAIHQLLSNWFPLQPPSISTVQKEVLVCSTCGFTFNNFLKLGKFGCANCYETFELNLEDIFKRLHNGNKEHAGKIPDSYGSRLKIKKEIEELRKQLKISIETEEFEKAARLRDEIRELINELERSANHDN